MTSDILVPDLENRQMEYEVRRTIVVSRAKLSRAKKTKRNFKKMTQKKEGEGASQLIQHQSRS